MILHFTAELEDWKISLVLVAGFKWRKNMIYLLSRGSQAESDKYSDRAHVQIVSVRRKAIREITELILNSFF